MPSVWRRLPTIASGLALASSLVLSVGSAHGAASPARFQDGGQDAVPVSASEYVYPSCRFGVTVKEPEHEYFGIVAKLNAGVYLDFMSSEHAAGPPEAEYVPIISLGQDRGGSNDCGPDYGYQVSPLLTDGGPGRADRCQARGSMDRR